MEWKVVRSEICIITSILYVEASFVRGTVHGNKLFGTKNSYMRTCTNFVQG